MFFQKFDKNSHLYNYMYCKSKTINDQFESSREKIHDKHEYMTYF